MTATAIPVTSKHKLRVVVVDDEVTIASSLKAILNHAGFDAHATFGGQELVDSLETLRPDVVIIVLTSDVGNLAKCCSSRCPQLVVGLIVRKRNCNAVAVA
jgi:PleD family two-component response regulator